MKNKVKKIVILFIIFSIVFQLSDCKNEPTAPSENDRVALWGEDIDYFDAQIKSKEYGFSSLVNEQQFDNTLKNIKSSVNSLQDYEIYIKLQQLLASFNVAHLSISPPSSEKFHFIPVITDFFPDGLYIIMTDQQNTALLGKKIISIGGTPIQTVEDSLKKIISHENDYWAEKQIPTALLIAEVLKYYGFTNDLSQVELEVDGIGNVTVHSVEASGIESSNVFTSGLNSVLDGKTVPLYLQKPSINYWYTFIKENKVLYIKYNSCYNISDNTFDNFTSEIKNFISTHDVEKIVVDLRNNGGGISTVINPLLSYIQSSSFNEEGKLFIVIDKGTFSSALLNAIYFKDSTNSILVGEPTGGKPNSYGEVYTFSLPNSGIIIHYCTKYFNEMADDPESLYPDYDIEITAQDYVAGRDPVLDFILNYK